MSPSSCLLLHLLLKLAKDGQIGKWWVYPTPCRLSGLLSHAYSALLLEEQLAEDPTGTSASSVWLHILVPDRIISYKDNKEKFPRKEENKVALSSSRP